MKEPFNLSERTGLYKSTRSLTKEDIVQQALIILRNDLGNPGVALTSPQDSRDFLMLKLSKREHEVFACLYLDNRHRVIAYEELFRGTIDGASVYPREVVKSVLSFNAAAVIFAHNHPSGVSEPSQADRTITRKLVDSLSTVDVRVLDHIIIGRCNSTSFAERGLL